MEFEFVGTSGLGDVRRLTVGAAGVQLRSCAGMPVGLETSFRDTPRLRLRLAEILSGTGSAECKCRDMLAALRHVALGRVWQTAEPAALGHGEDALLDLLGGVLDGDGDAVRRAHELLAARGRRQPMTV